MSSAGMKELIELSALENGGLAARKRHAVIGRVNEQRVIPLARLLEDFDEPT